MVADNLHTLGCWEDWKSEVSGYVTQQGRTTLMWA